MADLSTQHGSPSSEDIPSHIDLSIVIVSYNVRHFLQRTLESTFRAQNGLSLEIFVVDNDSADDSVEMVRSQFPHVHMIEAGGNLGFAKANNLALKQARGDFLMILNPDCLLQEDSLTTLVQFLKDHPDAGAVGPKLLNRDGTFQVTSKRGLPTVWASFCKLSGLSSVFPKSKFFNRYEQGHLDPDEVNEVEILAGAAMMIRREVYEKVGGLDEDYFMFGEDVDWSWAIGQAGWKLYYVPTTQIIHYKGESTKQKGFDREKHFYNAMRLFTRKHSRFGLLARSVIELGIFVGEFIARLRKNAGLWGPALIDMLLIFGLFVTGYIIRFTYFPTVWGPAPAPITLEMWAVCIAYAVLGCSALAIMGVYTSRGIQPRRIFFGMLFGFALVGALAYFWRAIQFSRVVLASAGVASILLLPVWRWLVQALGAGEKRRIVVAGVDRLGREVVRRVREGAIPDVEVVGWLVFDEGRLGDTIDELPVLGTATDLSQVSREHRIREALFSSASASYEDIFRIASQHPVKGVAIQVIPDGFDRDERMPLLAIDVAGGWFAGVKGKDRPTIQMRQR